MSDYKPRTVVVGPIGPRRSIEASRKAWCTKDGLRHYLSSGLNALQEVHGSKKIVTVKIVIEVNDE